MKIYLKIILIFLLLPVLNAAVNTQVLKELEKKPEWLFPYKTCPSEIIPKHETQVSYLHEKCKPDMMSCLNKCQSNDGNACYALALAVKELKTDESYSESLFHRACKLGVTSACTNRAAGIMHSKINGKGELNCATRTFKKACLREDPWACTMYSFNLFKGFGTEKNLDLALSVLKGSCKFGMEDEACQRAQNLKRMIVKEKNADKKTTN